MTEDISIIILTKNGGERFQELLTRLDSQSCDRSFETIVIDSGSTDGTVSVAENFDTQIHEIPPDEFHHSRTRNLGAKKATGEILVYITQDALPTSDNWLTDLTDPINKQIGVVYGRQIARQDAKPTDKFFYSYFYPEQKELLTQKDVHNPRQFYLNNIFVSDVCSAIRHDVWQEIQFDENIGMSEDKDFALRALQSGHEIVYEPTASVYHSHDYSIRSKFVRRFKDGAAFARIASEGEDQFISKGLNYVLAEMKYLFQNNHFQWIPYVILYNFIHFIGFQLGKIGGQLPGVDRLI